MSGFKLLLSDARGVYIPRDFAEIVRAGMSWEGHDPDDIAILLEGPDAEHYWDAWDAVMNDISFVDSKGNSWHLWQDGDLWLFCEDVMTDEEFKNFFGEGRVEEVN